MTCGCLQKKLVHLRLHTQQEEEPAQQSLFWQPLRGTACEGHSVERVRCQSHAHVRVLRVTFENQRVALL